MRELPSVGVVLPTHNRPELLAEALSAVLAQEYSGALEAVVVFDRSRPDPELVRSGPRPVRVVANARTEGLVGARNTGILALGTDLVAFCDDDDVWLPGKLVAQIAALMQHDSIPFSTCAIEVAFGGRRSARVANMTLVRHRDLLRSRMSMLHSSTFVMDRVWLSEAIGALDESAPSGQNEDWDLLLRVTEHGSIAHVDRPLVQVRWGTSSSFQHQWETRARALDWILDRHPDITSCPAGAARVYGQLAFANAAIGRRKDSLRWMGRALLRRPTEWRTLAALAVASGLIDPGQILGLLHRFGRGV